MGPMRRMSYEEAFTVSYSKGSERPSGPIDFHDDVTEDAVESIRQKAATAIGDESEWEVVSGYVGKR